MIKILLAVYNLLFALLIIPVLIVLLIFSSKYRKEIFYKLPERFAFWKFVKDSSKKTVWIHCASLGEVRAAEPVINGLKDDYFIVLTVLTKTGRDYAKKIEKLQFVSLLPLDIYPLMLKVFNAVKPDIFILVETELWASTLYAAKKTGVKIMTVNGRMSEKSFNFYKKFSFFFKPFISLIDIVLARNSSDAMRFAVLLEKDMRISISGNIKYDRDFKVNSKRVDYGLKSDDIVFTAGSTRPEETQIIVQAYKELKQKYQNVKFFLAPRHLAYLGKVKKILEENKIEYYPFSSFVVTPSARQFCAKGSLSASGLSNSLASFVVVDVFGKLQSIYAVSDFSFVGGSLINKGGQNPIEPAACAKPVIFGKYMGNFKAEADLLLKSGGAFQVSNAKDLASKIAELIENKQIAIAAGQNALKAVETQKGAVKITLEQIKAVLGDY
jgi:3-deoxy-D-manno-octulosonic-acid transferase